MAISYDPKVDWADSPEYKRYLEKLKESKIERNELLHDIGFYDNKGSVTKPYEKVYSEMY